MTDTARDLIQGSLRLIGALASGESASDSEANDGLIALNDLIDAWSTERLTIPNIVREVFSLVSGQKTYTMGVGGTFNTSRPQSIDRALIQFTTTTPVTELPMRILNTQEYAELPFKTLTSSFPILIYSDNASPAANITVWPVPDNSSYSVVLYSVKPLSNLTNLSTALALPPGYQRALRYGLALDLAAEYGKSPSEIVVEIANQAKAEIKRMNVEAKYARVDDALMARPRRYNILSGEYT